MPHLDCIPHAPTAASAAVITAGSTPSAWRCTRSVVTSQHPAGAASGGYKVSGIGRETHKMTLEHYSQTKNLLVSYGTKPLGFF